MDEFNENYRGKKIYKNPNPLFVKWLTELKDVAVSKETNLRFVYAKVNKHSTNK